MPAAPLALACHATVNAHELGQGIPTDASLKHKQTFKPTFTEGGFIAGSASAQASLVR